MTHHEIDGPISQHPLPLFGGVTRQVERWHSYSEITSCADDRDVAIEMMRCDPIRGRRDGFYADHLGIDRSAWSRMLSSSAKDKFRLTFRQWLKLAQLTRSRLAPQFMAAVFDCDLAPHKQTVEEKAALYDAQQASG